MNALWTVLLACTRPAPLPATDGADPLQALHTAIEAGHYRRIEAVVVQQGDEVLFDRTYRRTTAQARIDARSAGKSITAMAVGTAVDRGLLSVQDPAFAHLADLEPFEHPEGKDQILVRDLLSMSSSLDCSDWRPSPGNEERMYRTRSWSRFAVDLPLDPDFARNAEGQGRFSYCTAGAFLLGRILERITGEPFDAYVDRVLFEPLGIEDPVWRRSPTGEVQSGGQLSLRAHDFLALANLLRDVGVHDGERLLSEDWIREMVQPKIQATPSQAYGYLWWVRTFRAGPTEDPVGGFYMSGNGGNKVVWFPHLDAVAVVLATNYNDRDMHELTTDLLERYVLVALTR
ncbi:MAG: beta-lactamase family protein [Myxococcales bacterium]|nr:beta-lactamase family protein [Myxococcales bacterium]